MMRSWRPPGPPWGRWTWGPGGTGAPIFWEDPPYGIASAPMFAPVEPVRLTPSEICVLETSAASLAITGGVPFDAAVDALVAVLRDYGA